MNKRAYDSTMFTRDLLMFYIPPPSLRGETFSRLCLYSWQIGEAVCAP